MEKKLDGGFRLLRENPLKGMPKRLKIRPNKTPAQPIVAHATYEMLRRSGRGLPMYVRLFLAMAEGTGRRASALRELQWTDVDLETEMILWRGETDKMGLEMHRPATVRVIRYLRVWRKRCPSSVWVFPAPKDASRPVPKETVDKWTQQLYDAAGLIRPDHAGWHSFRRKWASERKGHPIPDLMVAGGWASAEALMRYLKTDDETIAQVVHQPTRRIKADVRTEVRTPLKLVG
jgi:integrase